MVEDLLIIGVCWIVGIVWTTQTDWVVRQAKAIQDKYPRAFSSRLADRRWYPRFVKLGGIFCLVGATILMILRVTMN